MTNFGKTVHKLRVSRRITQKELAEGLFDRSMLSKIEQGALSTTYENELELIARLGLTPNEFEYINNNYQINIKQKLLHRFFELTANSELTKINELLDDCSHVQNDNDVKRVATVLQALLVMNKPHGFKKAQKLLYPIWFTYLRKVKVLTITDIAILNAVLFAFDTETANEIISKIASVIDEHYPFMQSLKTNLLINQTTLMMQQGKFAQATRQLRSLIRPIKDLNQFEKLVIVKTKIAVCQKDKEEAMRQLGLLYELEATELANGLKMEVEEYLPKDVL